MFYMVDTAENAVYVNGDVSIHVSPLAVVFRRLDTEVKVEPFAVHAYGSLDRDGKTIDFKTENPFVPNRRGSGVWAKTLRRNGVDVRVAVIILTRRKYELTISVGENVFCYSLLKNKPVICVGGNSKQWSEDIINFMKGVNEND